jgi:hypothetical protein
MARVVDARTQQLQAPSTAIVTKHAEDPKQDIVAERRRASFNTNELLYWLNGGKEKVERRWALPGNTSWLKHFVGTHLCSSKQRCCAAASHLHGSSSADQSVTSHQFPPTESTKLPATQEVDCLVDQFIGLSAVVQQVVSHCCQQPVASRGRGVMRTQPVDLSRFHAAGHSSHVDRSSSSQ